MRNSYDAVTRRLNDPSFVQQLLLCMAYGFAGSLLLNFILGSGLVYEITHRPRVKYIYHDSFGKPRELVATDQAYFSDSEVSQWATDKILNLYTLNWLNFAQHLDDAQTDFSVAAWNSWGMAFKGPGNIDFIKKNRVLLTASLKSAAIVEEEGLNRKTGNYEWHVAFPMYLKWVNPSDEKLDVLAVKVTIARTNDPLHPDGRVITELNAPLAGDGG